MTNCATCTQDDEPPWSAEHCAVWVEEMANDDGTRRVVMLRHPTYPFPASVPGQADPGTLEKNLRKVALEYIKQVRMRASIGGNIIAALEADDGSFGWLPLSWGSSEHHAAPLDPRHSFWVARRQSMARVDRTAVLLAGQRDKLGRGLGGEIGLRIVMHVLAVAVHGALQVRVTGMSMSNLPSDDDIERIDILATRDLGVYLALLQSLFRFAAPPAILGVALARKDPQAAVDRVRIFGAGSRGQNKDILRTYSFVTEFDLDPKDGTTARTLARLERLSHAHVLQRDPASSNTAEPVPLVKRRPTRPAEFLDQFRCETSRLPPEGKNDSGTPTGRSLLKNDYLQVRQTRIGSTGGDPDQVQEIPVDRLQLRSDDLAAAHAFVRGDELFARLLAYGLAPEEYFKLAKLPLLLRHRAPLRGAGDGKTVNAQVRPSVEGLSLLGEWSGPGPKDERTQLEVCFAAGNLAHRLLLPNDGDRFRAQPLGLAADQRWAWHEFGHVLAFAGTGALEFRFAHSAGDALAGIVADPDSALTSDSRPYEGDATFPWVPISRRHNRDANASWCWCGRRNTARRAHAAALDDRRLGYFQEQLMSSSLFRLYRCIGGETFADPAVQRGASDYTVYLVMRAIALLGPEVVVPARTADQFVSALIDADIGTGMWEITANWPEGEPERELMRVGGCVHKVVRWAFEMQGLYATEDPHEVKEGPGLPPCVDIYIEDCRAGADGGYEPVALQWNAAAPQKWHASDRAITVSAGKVKVTVGNRGQVCARNVKVSVRFSPADGPLCWTTLYAEETPAQDVPVGAAVEFEFTAPAGEWQQRYLVWASATCVADRANDDPDAMLPCLSSATPLVDLIANDNNQGLRIINPAK